MPSKKQIDAFKETARQLGADESDDALDKIMGNLDLKQQQEKPAKQEK